MKKVTVLTLFLVLLVSWACGGGAQTEEGRVKAAVEGVYALGNEQDYEALWNMYSSDFRARCSLEGMIDVEEGLREAGVERLEVVRFDAIEFREVEDKGDVAAVSYFVATFGKEGEQIGSYDYDVTLVKEGGEWLLDEQCFY